MSRRPLPDKLFFRIGEVAALVGVKPHVLRYWEEELGVLVPMKTRGSHRHYRRRDVELALTIRALLQDEGLTLSGVKKRLREQGLTGPSSAKAPVASLDGDRDAELRLRAVLVEARAELCAIAASLRPEDEPVEGASADVEGEASVAPALVLRAAPAQRGPRGAT